jgi:hypothetical protein
MPVRQNARTLQIKEQIIHLDGLTLMFRVVPDSTARYRLSIEGESLPFGNYEIVFDVEGNEAGGGTALPGLIESDGEARGS